MTKEDLEQKNFWNSVLRLTKPKYDHQRLVDRKTVIDPPWFTHFRGDSGESSYVEGTEPAYPSRHIISDIDKTYLETEFETLRKLVKTALEKEDKKSSVAGAPVFFRGIRKQGQGRQGVDSIHFVSSSPPQMRSVLRSKFSMDGLEWESDTFKNQVYNLVRGRPGELKKHVAYKTTAILELCRELPDGSEVSFIGDNVEADPYIFAGITWLMHGNMDAALYQRFLLDGLVLRQSALEICRDDFAWLRKKNITVKNIWIREAKPQSDEQVARFEQIRQLGLPLYYFPNFLDLSLYAFRLGLLLYPGGLSAFLRRLINEFGYGRASVLSCLETHLNSGSFARVKQQSRLWRDLSASDLKPLLEEDTGSAKSLSIDEKKLQELHGFCFG